MSGKQDFITEFSNGVFIAMLTENQKNILQNKQTKKGTKAGCNYNNQVKWRVSKKADRALEDFVFLAKKYPKSIKPELLLNFLEAYLNQEKFTITEQERKKPRTPPSLGRKRPPSGTSWIQIAGCLRDKDGRPLIKEIGPKICFCHMLLKAIYQSLKDTTFMIGSKDETEPILFINSNDVKITTLFEPKLILEGKMTLSDKIRELNSENSSNEREHNFVLWPC